MRSFSWPGGLPSHLSPVHPGVIHEGGELGYALAKSFGAAFDNPDLIVACIVGDGEFETGPTATAWHSSKFLNPATDGAVLPFLHRNGYKIANPTVPGTMSDEELRKLFEGYGWRPRFVDGDDLDESLAETLDWAHAEIRTIQGDARAGRPPPRPAWPVIIVTSPKGWTGIKELDGVPIEGTWRAHQVPAADCRTNPDHLAAVEAWLRSYAVEELVDADGVPAAGHPRAVPDGRAEDGMQPARVGGQPPRSVGAVADRALRGAGRASWRRDGERARGDGVLSRPGHQRQRRARGTSGSCAPTSWNRTNSARYWT